MSDTLTSHFKLQLRQAINFDRWGQLIEAVDSYKELMKLLKGACEQGETNVLIQMSSICEVISKRVKFLENPHEDEVIVLEDLKALIDDVDKFNMEGSRSSSISTGGPSLPGFTYSASGCTSRSASGCSLTPNMQDISNSSLIVHTTRSAKLNCGIQRQSGYTYLTVFLDKIGIKECATLLDCYITMHVKDEFCVDVSAAQDTAITNHKDPPYIVFSYNLLMTTPLELFPKGAAIFFELHHFKPKKSSSSCKCFTFMEMDELKEGGAALELYKKPTDFKRKKLTLLSVKPLYLHVKLKLEKAQ